MGESTQFTDHVDATAQRDWREFVESGMPGLIESYNFVHALFALTDSGLVGRLRAGATTRAQLSEGLDPEMTTALLRFMTVRGVLAAAPDANAPDASFSLTERGRKLTSELSHAQMGFYREAYGPVLDRMGPLLRKQEQYPSDVARNGEALGRHCTVGFHFFGTSVVLRGLELLNAKSVLDLGCGGAGFLIDACQSNPAVRGVGLDISEGAIGYARRCVADAGLEDRISLVVGDASQPERWPEVCRKAEAIMTVGTLHEQFRGGEGAVIALLDKYADLMATTGAKGMVIGEPDLVVDKRDADFYLVHVFTRQGLPRLRDAWLPLFEKTKLRCDTVLTAVGSGPPFSYYILRPRT